MAEVNKTQQTGSSMTDIKELQSTRTHGQRLADDLKLVAGPISAGPEQPFAVDRAAADESKEKREIVVRNLLWLGFLMPIVLLIVFWKSCS